MVLGGKVNQLSVLWLKLAFPSPCLIDNIMCQDFIQFCNEFFNLQKKLTGIGNTIYGNTKWEHKVCQSSGMKSITRLPKRTPSAQWRISCHHLLASLCLLLRLVGDGAAAIWITTRIWSRATGHGGSIPELVASLDLQASAPLSWLRVTAAPLYARRHLPEIRGEWSTVEWSLPLLPTPRVASAWRFSTYGARLVCCICSNLVRGVQVWADWLRGSADWPGLWRAKHPTGPGSQETKTKSVSNEPGSLGREGACWCFNNTCFSISSANQSSAKFVQAIVMQLAKCIYIACTWPGPFQPGWFDASQARLRKKPNAPMVPLPSWL
jgi:hypothetical protein